MAGPSATLVLGASVNPRRYSFLAVKSLLAHGHRVLALGRKSGSIDSVQIETGFPDFKEVDTVSVYMNAENQKIYYDYLLRLRPRRIIFNPGAENPEFSGQCLDAGIEPVEACTLVLLSIGAF